MQLSKGTMSITTHTFSKATLLNDLALYRASGPDAGSFLHGQLTNDVTGLPSDRAALAGYCSPKGRLLSTLIYWHTDDQDQPGFYLLMKSSIAQAVAKRLKMFILRAKVSLEPVEQAIVGVHCPDDTHPANLAPSSGASEAWSLVRNAQGSWIKLPHAQQGSRWIWLPSPDAPNVPTMVDPVALQNWQSADILAGLPWVQEQTQDTFIPQTLNLDLIHGVSFTKGCYPGQEVVARAHYRGTVKRRMFVASAQATADAVIAGIDIYQANQENPCGRVVNAATENHAGQNRVVMLLELPIAEANTSDLRLGSPQGPAVTVLTLPYPLEAA